MLQNWVFFCLLRNPACLKWWNRCLVLTRHFFRASPSTLVWRRQEKKTSWSVIHRMLQRNRQLHHNTMHDVRCSYKEGRWLTMGYFGEHLRIDLFLFFLPLLESNSMNKYFDQNGIHTQRISVMKRIELNTVVSCVTTHKYLWTLLLKWTKSLSRLRYRVNWPAISLAITGLVHWVQIAPIMMFSCDQNFRARWDSNLHLLLTERQCATSLYRWLQSFECNKTSLWELITSVPVTSGL